MLKKQMFPKIKIKKLDNLEIISLTKEQIATIIDEENYIHL